MPVIDATWKSNTPKALKGPNLYPYAHIRITKRTIPEDNKVVTVSSEMVQAIVLLCGANNRIGAIKLFREVYYCHLISAKKAVEYIWETYGHA